MTEQERAVISNEYATHMTEILQTLPSEQQIAFAKLEERVAKFRKLYHETQQAEKELNSGLRAIN